jgi:GNAT superfamily N-acetyltransferase
VNLRPTTPADLEALYAVFRAAIGDLYARHAFAPPEPPFEVFAAQQRHLLECDGERCWVAVERDEVVAYVSAFRRGHTWFLSSLFVRPDAQGRGLGPRLLDRAWVDGAERRLTITDAIQPVSNALYARRGLIPATPILSFAGAPRVEPPADLEPAEPTGRALQVLDLAAYGFDRTLDHEHWRRAGQLTVWARGGEPLAYAYVWPGRAIGPIAGTDGDAAAAALRAELGRRDGASCAVRVPGSAAAAVEVAVAAGLRVAGPPGLLLLSRPHRPPEGLVIGSYTLL